MSNIGQMTGREPRKPTAMSPAADLERWEIDPARSKLTFTLRHLVISEIKGSFGRWGGTLYLDRGQPSLSSVQVWIDVSTIDTGEPERDDHIRSSEFLDAKQLPRAEFESSAVEEKDGRAVVRGRLRLHGVTRDIDVDVEPYAPPAPGGKNVYRLRAKLDRQSFGLHWNQDLDFGGVVVGDEIRITAELALVHTNGGAP
jgi:polyisoprenoid-binding protein YceI